MLEDGFIIAQGVEPIILVELNVQLVALL